MRLKNFFVLLIIVGVVGYSVKRFIELEQYNNQIIKVKIILKNNCELIDDAFMVVSYPEEKIAKFSDGRAEMFLPRKSKVQLAANNKYEGFHYSSLPVKVSKSVKLEANCTESDRLDNIFDSLRNQFNK